MAIYLVQEVQILYLQTHRAVCIQNSLNYLLLLRVNSTCSMPSKPSIVSMTPESIQVNNSSVNKLKIMQNEVQKSMILEIKI